MQPRPCDPWSTPHSAPTCPCDSTAGTAARSGPSDADVVVRFTTRRALRRLIWAPNELGFARAYVSGDVEIEGDLLDGLTRLNALADPERGPGVHVGADTRAAVARAVVRLGALGPTSTATCGGDPAVRSAAREGTGREGGLPPLRRR